MNVPSLLSLFLFKRKWGATLRELSRDKKLRSLTIAALALNIAAWAGSIFVNTRVSGDVIALHHNIYFGITLIGSPRQTYLIPILGLCIIVFNLVIVRLTGRRERFFIYLFATASLIVQFFLLLGIGSIILINFR
jgi:hypothetical protein